MNVKKYDGCGNSFVIIPYEEQLPLSQLAIDLCGHQVFQTDGLICVKEQPLEMIFYNRDGSLAPMCGNGLRCFAKYVLDEGILSSDTQVFEVQTLAGVMKVEVLQLEPFLCRVNIGRPIFDQKAIGVADEKSCIQRKLVIDNEIIEINTLFMGTIHTVVFVQDAKRMLESHLGQRICEHPLFLEKTNVNFVEVVSNSHLVVRTYERGVGWTDACATGCCASYVMAKKFGYVTGTVEVSLEKGSLLIEGESDIYMSGPAVYHFAKEMEDIL